MNQNADNKHSGRSAQTRQRFIEAAQKLFAERSIDSVSLNEITVAAGQKNRSALQYHFVNRDGLLQAIIDAHSQRVRELRQPFLTPEPASRKSGRHRKAAKALVRPLTDYIEKNPSGVYYIKILSQLAVLNSPVLNPTTTTAISFDNDEALAQLFRQALSHLHAKEIRRRMFLTISMTFHGIADICRATEADNSSATLRTRRRMFGQVILAVESLLQAEPLE